MQTDKSEFPCGLSIYFQFLSAQECRYLYPLPIISAVRMYHCTVVKEYSSLIEHLSLQF